MKKFDVNSIFMDVMRDPKATAIMKPFIDQLMAAFSPDPTLSVFRPPAGGSPPAARYEPDFYP